MRLMGHHETTSKNMQSIITLRNKDVNLETVSTVCFHTKNKTHINSKHGGSRPHGSRMSMVSAACVSSYHEIDLFDGIACAMRTIARKATRRCDPWRSYGGTCRSASFQQNACKTFPWPPRTYAARLVLMGAVCHADGMAIHMDCVRPPGLSTSPFTVFGIHREHTESPELR